MRLSSTAFDEGGMLPPRFTCDGDGASPPLEWKDVPDGTQTFALICEDPDAPSGMFTHWPLFNLSAGSRELPEGIPKDAVLSIGARQGTNSFGNVGYGGACPPSGESIVISLSSTRWMPTLASNQVQEKSSYSTPCEITFWRRLN